MTKGERVLEQWLLHDYLSKDKFCGDCGVEISKHSLGSGLACRSLERARNTYEKYKYRANNNPYPCPDRFDVYHLMWHSFKPWYGYTCDKELRGYRKSIMFRHGLSTTFQYGNHVFGYISDRYKGKRYIPKDVEERLNRKLARLVGFGNHHRPYFGGQAEFGDYADGDFCRVDLNTSSPVDSSECKGCGEDIVDSVSGGIRLMDKWGSRQKPAEEFCRKETCQKISMWLRYPGGLETVGEIQPKRPLKLIHESEESLRRAIILAGYVDYKARAIENEKRNKIT